MRTSSLLEYSSIGSQMTMTIERRLTSMRWIHEWMDPSLINVHSCHQFHDQRRKIEWSWRRHDDCQESVWTSAMVIGNYLHLCPYLWVKDNHRHPHDPLLFAALLQEILPNRSELFPLALIATFGSWIVFRIVITIGRHRCKEWTWLKLIHSCRNFGVRILMQSLQ